MIQCPLESTDRMTLPKPQILSFSAATVATLIVGYVISVLTATDRTKFFHQFFVEGYDFRTYQSGDPDFAKHTIGEKLELTKIVSSGGRRLSEFDESFILLNVTDPQCGYSRLAKDVLQNVRGTAVDLGIRYVPVIFVPVPEHTNLERYSRNLGFDEAYRWEAHSFPPDLYSRMATPSHILVKKDGTILRVWFTSNKNAQIRKRMSSQLSLELRLIVETLAIGTTNDLAAGS